MLSVEWVQRGIVQAKWLDEPTQFVAHAHLVLLFVWLLYVIVLQSSNSLIKCECIQHQQKLASNTPVCALFSHCETSAAVPGKPAGSYATSLSLAL